MSLKDNERRRKNSGPSLFVFAALPLLGQISQEFILGRCCRKRLQVLSSQPRSVDKQKYLISLLEGGFGKEEMGVGGGVGGMGLRRETVFTLNHPEQASKP